MSEMGSKPEIRNREVRFALAAKGTDIVSETRQVRAALADPFS
jgi:hypothetical protein